MKDFCLKVGVCDNTPVGSPKNTRFEDFVPPHKLMTWEALDEEESWQKKANSFAGIASSGVQMLSKQVKNIVEKQKTKK